MPPLMVNPQLNLLIHQHFQIDLIPNRIWLPQEVVDYFVGYAEFLLATFPEAGNVWNFLILLMVQKSQTTTWDV